MFKGPLQQMTFIMFNRNRTGLLSGRHMAYCDENWFPKHIFQRGVCVTRPGNANRQMMQTCTPVRRISFPTTILWIKLSICCKENLGLSQGAVVNLTLIGVFKTLYSWAPISGPLPE